MKNVSPKFIQKKLKPFDQTKNELIFLSYQLDGFDRLVSQLEPRKVEKIPLSLWKNSSSQSFSATFSASKNIR